MRSKNLKKDVSEAVGFIASDEAPFKPSRYIEYRFAVAYALIFILAIIPYYNWYYRILVNISLVICFLASIPVILISAIRHLIRFELRGSIISIALAVAIFVTGLHVNYWRYVITNRLIMDNYCDLEAPLNGVYILGGIYEIYVADLDLGRSGAFENSSHCLIVVCTEEFYYCGEGKVSIER